jgi:hypothetical protein
MLGGGAVYVAGGTFEVANPISTWAALKSAVGAAAGTKTTLTLSPQFTMAGYDHQPINIRYPITYPITIEGNGAIFDAGGDGTFFVVDQTNMVLKNITMKNAKSDRGGAITWYEGAFLSLSDCIFAHNSCAEGALSVGMTDSGGYATLENCVFLNNTASEEGHGVLSGGAVSFGPNTSVRNIIKNCSFVGPIGSLNNDISRKYSLHDGSCNVTFVCADGEVGTPVQMQGQEITVIPPKELKCIPGNCFCRDSKCVVDPTATLPCAKCETPGACV